MREAVSAGFFGLIHGLVCFRDDLLHNALERNTPGCKFMGGGPQADRHGPGAPIALLDHAPQPFAEAQHLVMP